MALVVILQPETDAGVARVQLDIERIDFGSPETSGRQGGVQAGWPLWSGRWELDKLDPVASDLWRAFVARLRGRQRVFIGYDTTRPYPRSTPRGFAGQVRAGGGAFGGSASGWSQNVDASGNASIGLVGLPAGLVLGVGDYVGWKWDAAGAPAGSFTRRALARVVVGGTASAGGGITVMVEPPLDPRVVPANAVAHLDKPSALFRLDTDATKLGAIGAGLGMTGATIVADQDLRP